MIQNNIPHMTPYTGLVQVDENIPILLHTFGLRIQLYARSKFLMTNDRQDIPKLYDLI